VVAFQACRHGLVQHLEHLLFYGADMNARNASGNTPLHVCAVNGQDSCSRLLLFRGADREALNYANQTPYQVFSILYIFCFELFNHIRVSEGGCDRWKPGTRRNYPEAPSGGCW
jgi:Ankyrin repeats (3 copies)